MVWITKYRYKILNKAVNERMQTIMAMENGVISSNHLHLLVAIPPHVAISDFVQRAEGRFFAQSSTRISRAKENILGKVFLGKGYFSAT